MRRGRIVERRKRGGYVVDWDAVAGHSLRRGCLIASVLIESVQVYHRIQRAIGVP